MNLQELIKYVRKISPINTIDRISESELTFFLNEAVKEVSLDAQLFPADVLFDIVSGKSEYSITAIDNRIIGINKSGLYWYNGTSWRQINPKSKKYLDEKYPTWRDRDSGNPEQYFIEGDILTIFPKPDTTLTNGGKLSVLRRPVAMTNLSDQPFGVDSDISIQISRYDILSWSVLDKTKVYLFDTMNEPEKAIQQEQLYISKLNQRLKLINTRRDIAHTRYAVMGNSYAPTHY